MHDDILVPTDGSDTSMAAVDEAIEIADRQQTTVHFLYVVDAGTEMSAGASGSIAPQLTETLDEKAESALDDATTHADRTDVNYDRAILEGDPHEVIAEYSAEHDIDLIVMGASGRSGLKEHLLGSTTDRVLRTVDSSVLIARP